MTMDNTINSEQPEARRSLHADVRCVGRGAADGCGYKGGQSGYACPKCGGMLLSKPARTDAIRLAATWLTWLNEEASNDQVQTASEPKTHL